MEEDLKELTAQIVAAFVQKNRIAATELPHLIGLVHRSLASVGPAAPQAAQARKLTPAQIRKSVTHDAVTSFEDGRPYKSLKRHLARHGLTPAEYREKWGLPPDYPMVAPSYSEARSALAKSAGLGARSRKDPQALAEKGPGRGRKASAAEAPSPDAPEASA